MLGWIKQMPRRRTQPVNNNVFEEFLSPWQYQKAINLLHFLFFFFCVAQRFGRHQRLNFNNTNLYILKTIFLYQTTNIRIYYLSRTEIL